MSVLLRDFVACFRDALLKSVLVSLIFLNQRFVTQFVYFSDETAKYIFI